LFDRKAHWQNVYQDKSSLDVSWYQKEPSLSLELIHSTQVARDEAIIDVGGGASVLVDHLCKERYTNLAVLDISENALASAKKRLGDLAKSVEWIESDITQFDAPHQFSLWHDRAVFHFLTDQSDRKSYVKAIKRALRPGGHLIIAAFAIGGPEKCSGLDIVQYDADKLIAELGEDFELVEERDETHITPANKEQKFMYFRFIKIPENKET
jgi:ubiquinone/menaquinone biosynthesis C-methylase UbiE